jgi:hypothetical protein
MVVVLDQHFDPGASMSLNAIASRAVRDSGPRAILVRCLTVAKVDSMVLSGCHR